VEWKIEMWRGAGAQIEAKLQVVKLLMIDRKSRGEILREERDERTQRSF
jgi:hypothetical protein